jgi:formylglycine-generating enzyme required for sulfatase activity
VSQLPRVNHDLSESQSYFEDSGLPVVCVTWFEAKEFCDRLSKKTGREYRIPSEAEWEYACRAGTTTPFAFGETITPETANFRVDRDHRYTKGQPIPASDLKLANDFGLFGMHGGVWEWCQDVWHENYYGDAPGDGTAWLTGGDETYRVTRGGSWDEPLNSCRAAFRKYLAPDRADDDVGLRVVCSLPEGG